MAGITRSQPRELGYAEIVSDFTATSAATDVTGLSVTFVAGTRPVYFDAQAQVRGSAVSSVQWYMTLTPSGGGGTVLRSNFASIAAANSEYSSRMRKRRSDLVPGTVYAVKITLLANTGTGKLVGGQTDLLVTEAPG